MNNNSQIGYKYPIASTNTHPTIERAIDIMNGYLIRYNDFIDTINKNIVFGNALKEYISLNKYFPNRKSENKDKLRTTITDSLVEMNIYNQIEIKWLRYHDYFELFIQMLQTSKIVSDILSSNDKVD